MPWGGELLSSGCNAAVLEGRSLAGRSDSCRSASSVMGESSHLPLLLLHAKEGLVRLKAVRLCVHALGVRPSESAGGVRRVA